jgi:phospholipase/carboxylesterase
VLARAHSSDGIGYTAAVPPTSLTVRTVGTLAPGGLTIVLLHGFGAPGDDLVDLGRYLEAPPGSRFVFPAAPIEMGGLYGDSRAWWMIDLSSFDRPKPQDRSEEVPEGIDAARQLVTAVLEKLVEEGAGPIVLGGFSQGAMLSLDTALHLESQLASHLAGLVLMSGTPINGAAWTPRMAKMKDLPVLVSHGRRDPLLSFTAAQAMADRLRTAGAHVDWVEFDGGHEIPPPVLAGAIRVLRAASERARRQAGASAP